MPLLFFCMKKASAAAAAEALSLFNSGQIVVIQPFFGCGADPAQGVGIEGIAQACLLQQVGKHQRTAQLGILEVGFKGGLGVLLNPGPEVQGHGLGQAVVNVVEGAGIDVALALPALALAVEGDLAGLHTDPAVPARPGAALRD